MWRKYAIFGSGEDAAHGGQGYYPSDIRQAYGIPEHLDGSGQSIGILEFSNGFSLPDAQSFWQMHNITPPDVEFISVDGTRNDHGQSRADQEASLDLQWAGALAPGAKLLVYEAAGGRDYQSFSDAMSKTLRYVLNDSEHAPSVLSISYGDAEASFGDAAIKEWSDLIDQLDAAGVTVCVASGDQGAYGRHTQPGPGESAGRNADAPASIPSCVAVGGTSLAADGSESAWTYKDRRNGGATGGGFSNVFPRPDFQSALDGPSGRGLPDVAFNADPATGYQIVFQQKNTVVGGTSVACPVFAAIVALANQARANEGGKPLTGLTQYLYQHASSLPFNDITAGNNSFAGVEGFQAVPGWDACTGWGSLNAQAFIDQLKNASST
ncbi:S53 family peptidase [Salinisphaera hydrothermalis]|uniref:Tripeptidyl-peptidase I n=1 Tax=Salinisphaera hydrothermalis (strain C41B8) TaxID=1304275 RepID=A0A084IKT1_SALHC|nr:S53 family peptidase [Salinisphaera hydrothermalis]KEZ77315.1 Tripeptidyl-peptidase I [Salinisphaera hydrothermalis C41B8]